MQTWWLYLYGAAMLVMSVVAFFAYGADKRKAQKGKWRTPEAVLLGLGFLFGAAGALLGMKVYRHKTKHWYFWAVNFLSLALHLALLAAGIYFVLR